jgi:REP element-mobilizing transposase RayT
MARKLRLEEVGGLYHVINRGNYRQPVFASNGAIDAFNRTLGETVRQFGWRLHAYVIMSNHYHLALETPQPNLSDGMHRLQSAFAIRFNRFRGESGHLFQGRYQALRIENSAVLSRVIDYIHLNPVRAKMIEPTQLISFRPSSLPHFASADRPPGLTCDLMLAHRGLTDTPETWADYIQELTRLALDEAEQKRLGFDTFGKGWAIGTEGWKRALAKELRQTPLVGLAQMEAKFLREDRWQIVLDRALIKARKSAHDLTPLTPREKGHDWRLTIAAQLRSHGAPYAWIASKLGFPQPNSLKIKLFRFQCNNVSM